MSEIKININATDNGSISKLTKSAKELNKELTSAQKAAGGTRAAKDTAAMQKAEAAEANMYRQTRAGRGTGAEGRDFAKQAQGLGGLVHVYATFAANLFAVTAGFQALSKAADYSNMVKGLDQLGAASGKNLGTLSKDVAALTDGAVSMKEAMSAVAQATSAGMSNNQIERMAVVAKQASQALGRDMADSLNRLSRGITKLEPELLDEIGIFVRVDKAASDYALTMGKSAASLTDFERRQAFAVAALKQAEQKFGAIKLDANPYSKLQASVVDLLYKGGELLNKVLSPIAGILANSPTALGAGLIGIITLLTKQALPAIADFRAGLKASAEETAKTAQKYVEAAQAARTANLDKYKLAAEAEAETHQTAIERAATRENLLSTKGKSRMAGWVKELVDNPNVARDITDDQLTKLDALATKRNKVTGELTKSAKAYESLAISIRSARDAEANYDLVVNKIQEEKAKKAAWYTSEGMNQAIANRATRSSLSSRAVSDAAEATNVSGLSGGFLALRDSVKDAKQEALKAHTTFGAVTTGLTYVKGAAAIAATQISRLVSAFGWIGMAIGAAVAVFQLLNSWLSSNSKELELFNSGVTKTGEALEGLTRTSEYLSKLDPLERLSASSLEAKANAINGVAESVTAMVDGFTKANEKAGLWDNTMDWVSKLWGGDNASKLSESMGKAIQDTIVQTTSKGASQKLVSELEEVLGKGASLDTKAIEKLAKAGDTAALAKLGKILADNGKELSISAAKAKEYTQAMDQALKSNQSLMISFIPSDAMSKFGIDQMNAATALTKSVEDTEASFSALYETIKDNQKLALLPEQALRPLLDNLPKIREAQEEVGKLKEALVIYQQSLANKETELRGYGLSDKSISTNTSVVATKQAITEIYSRIDKHQKDASKYVGQMASALYEDGAKKLTTALGLASQKAALEYKSIIASAVGGEAGARMEAQVAREQLAIDKKQIEAAYSQVEALKKNTLAIEKSSVEAKLTSVESKLATPGLTPGEQADATVLQKTLKDRVSQIDKALDFIGGGNLQKRLGDNKKLSEQGMDSEAINQLRSDVGDLSLASIAKDVQLAAISGKGKAISLNEALKLNSETFKTTKDIYQEEQKRLTVEKEQLDLAKSSSVLYDEDLDNKIRINAQSLRDVSLANEMLSTLENQSKLEILLANLNKDSASHKEVAAALEKERVKGTSVQEIKLAQDRLSIVKQELELINSKYVLKQKEVDFEKQLLDLQTSSIEKLESASTLTKSEAIAEKARLDIRKESLSAELEISKLREASNVVGLSSAAKKAYEDQIKLRERDLALIVSQKEAQAEYDAAIVHTAESLKKMERGLMASNDYFKYVAQDFNNKVSELAKASQSAAEAFNDGFISAVDDTIDKYYDMLVTGTATWKEVVDTAKQGMMGAVRDFMAQTAKNAWKQLVKDIMGPSDEEKAAKNYTDSMKALIAALDRNTASRGGGGGGGGGAVDYSNSTIFSKMVNSKDYANQNTTAHKLNVQAGFTEEESKSFIDSASIQNEASKSLAGSVLEFGKSVYGLVTGNTKTVEGFLNVLGGFEKSIPTLLSSLTSIFSSSGGGAGGGSGASGIIEGVGKAYNWISSFFGPSTGGAFAKGATFYNSPGLSAYSNSIVSSPTTFAFAKGGVPNFGLMGEAGPEAIVPLTRMSDGNLGVRTANTTNENNKSMNLTINVNSQSGDPAEIRRSTAAAGRALLSMLNGAQRYG